MSGYTPSERLRALPPYLFAELDRMKQEQVKKGADIISLGIGDPDLPTPPHIIQALAAAAADPEEPSVPLLRGDARLPEGGGGLVPGRASAWRWIRRPRS